MKKECEDYLCGTSICGKGFAQRGKYDKNTVRQNIHDYERFITWATDALPNAQAEKDIARWTQKVKMLKKRLATLEKEGS